MARSTDQPITPDAHTLSGMWMAGWYNLAAIYNYSKELGYVENCYFTNDRFDSWLFHHSADNTENVTSEFVTLPNIQSCTQWLYTRNSFAAIGGPNAGGFHFSGGTPEHQFINNYYHIDGGHSMFVFKNWNKGPYTFHGGRLEGEGTFIGIDGGPTRGINLNAGRPAAPAGGDPPILVNGTLEAFRLNDINDNYSFNGRGVSGGDLVGCDIISSSNISININNLTRSRVILLNPDATVSVSGSIDGSYIRTQNAGDEFRQVLAGGITQYPPRTAAPTAGETGDVVMQDGSSWDPAGSGQQQLVTHNGNGWQATTQAQVVFDDTIGFSAGQTRTGLDLGTQVGGVPQDKQAVPFVAPDNTPAHKHGYHIDSFYADATATLRIQVTETENDGNNGVARYGLRFV